MLLREVNEKYEERVISIHSVHAKYKNPTIIKDKENNFIHAPTVSPDGVVDSPDLMREHG